jgi:hypothetical protein
MPDSVQLDGQRLPEGAARFDRSDETISMTVPGGQHRITIVRRSQ